MIRKGNLLKLLVNIIGFSQLAICRRKICSQKWVAMFTRKMPTVLNRMNNQFSDFSDFFLVMVDFVYNFPVCHLNFQVCHRPKIQKKLLSFKSGYIYIKDAQCAETHDSNF